MQHTTDMFSMGCVLYELLTDLRGFGRPEDKDLASDQLRQRVLLRHAAWVSSHPATFLVCHCAVSQGAFQLSISVRKKLGFYHELLPALFSAMFGCPLLLHFTCLDSCLRFNSLAASPILDPNADLDICHGRAFTHAACNHAFSWGMPVVSVGDYCLSVNQGCAAVVKSFCGAPDPAMCTCFVTAVMLFRAQTLLRANWCPMGWIS